MYFPILRGKQYELLALREFANEFGSTKLVSPIIEPVKKDFKGLDTTVAKLIAKNINFTIVVNPSVGDINESTDIISYIQSSASLANYPDYQIGINCNYKWQVEEIINKLTQANLQNSPFLLVHHDLLDDDYIGDLLMLYNIKFNLISDKIKSKRYRRLFNSSTRVSLEDPFIAQAKNSNYLNQIDEFFSDEYDNFDQEGNIGFADFATVGDSYSDGGFLPYAVAIHLTYEKSNSIRIRHFVSDSNEDFSDTPGKFAEALNKLISFVPELSHTTQAVETFKNIHTVGHYPGLGTIKKLSILNHLELIHHLLDLA